MSDTRIPEGFFSARVGRITVSPSNAGAQRVRELRAQGRDIIGLTIGEPDFETPSHVKQAAAEAMATPGALEAAITPRTKWLVLNSPCNPTGAVYSRAELKALAVVLLRHPRVWVIADDIYEHLVFDGVEVATIAEVEPTLYDRTLTVNGVAKTYAMTGWCIGYGGGPVELIRNMKKVQSQSTTCPSSIGQAAAIRALNGPQDFVRGRAQAFQERRDRVLELLREAPGIECVRPQGAFYIFANCAGTLGKRTPQGVTLETERDTVDYLLDGGVAVVLGAAYGLSPYFRMSIAASMAELTEACQRIRRAVAAPSPR